MVKVYQVFKGTKLKGWIIPLKENFKVVSHSGAKTVVTTRSKGINWLKTN